MAEPDPRGVVFNVEARLRESQEMAKALVAAAGGSVTLGATSLLGVRIEELRLERNANGSITLRLVDPNAPVEGGAYFIKVDGKKVGRREWIAATFILGKWWIVGDADPVTPTEVSDRIFHPGEMG